jgi:hypothetical protein
MIKITDNFIVMFSMAMVIVALILQTANGFFDADVGETLIGMMILFQAWMLYMILGEDNG